MSKSFRVEIKKFNGQNFELWKLKMEDILVDKEQWVAIDLCTKPTAMSKEDWETLERKARSMIHLCLSDLVLLNVYRKDTAKDLWGKLGNLYHSKSLVNKLFLRNKLCRLRMEDGDSMTEHANAFNTLVSQLIFVDIKMEEEYKCITLLCYVDNFFLQYINPSYQHVKSIRNLKKMAKSPLRKEGFQVENPIKLH